MGVHRPGTPSPHGLAHPGPSPRPEPLGQDRGCQAGALGGSPADPSGGQNEA